MVILRWNEKYKSNFHKNKKVFTLTCEHLILRWSHLGSNQGLADYESATLTN